MRDEPTKFYITKYALTTGIITVLGHRSTMTSTMITAPAKLNGGCMDQYYHRSDWHMTYAEAKAHAEQMRQKRIASLKASLAKMEKLTFPDELV